MPPISSLQNLDLSGYQPVTAPPASTQQLEQPLLPTRSPLLRFSAPFIAGTFPSSDTLRGFHLGGIIPQWRIPLPPTIQAGNATATSTAATVISSSSSTTINTTLAQKTQSVSTPTISTNQNYTGSVTLSTAYVLSAISSSLPARVRLYTSASAQSTDLTRPITQGFGYGSGQGLVCDVDLTNTPAVWALDPPAVAVGANAGSFITITNLDNTSVSLNITLNYVVLTA